MKHIKRMVCVILVLAMVISTFSIGKIQAKTTKPKM